MLPSQSCVPQIQIEHIVVCCNRGSRPASTLSQSSIGVSLSLSNGPASPLFLHPLSLSDGMVDREEQGEGASSAAAGKWLWRLLRRATGSNRSRGTEEKGSSGAG